MRQKLATQALERLSLKIGLLWIDPNGFGAPISKMPDIVTADSARELMDVYIRARAAYDAENYLAAIQIATEDEL